MRNPSPLIRLGLAGQSMLLVLAISGCGSELGQLRTDLQAPDGDARYDALKQIEQLGVNAAPAVQDVAICLSDDDPRIRYRAAKVLSKIGRAAGDVADALAQAVATDPDPDVRYYAAKALDHVPGSAANELATLTTALNDDSPKVRYYVAKLMGKIGAPAQIALSDLERLSDDHDESVRKAAKNAIRRIRKKLSHS